MRRPPCEFFVQRLSRCPRSHHSDIETETLFYVVFPFAFRTTLLCLPGALPASPLPAVDDVPRHDHATSPEQDQLTQHQTAALRRYVLRDHGRPAPRSPCASPCGWAVCSQRAGGSAGILPPGRSGLAYSRELQPNPPPSKRSGTAAPRHSQNVYVRCVTDIVGLGVASKRGRNQNLHALTGCFGA